MAETIHLKLGQDKRIVYHVPQGVFFEIPVYWLKEDGVTPIDGFSVNSFTGIIETADETEVHEFALVADAEGNSFSIDTDEGLTNFFVSDELCARFKINTTYFFEARMINLLGNPVERILIEIISER